MSDMTWLANSERGKWDRCMVRPMPVHNETLLQPSYPIADQSDSRASVAVDTSGIHIRENGKPSFSS
jgi:hypothetical protein